MRPWGRAQDPTRIVCHPCRRKAKAALKAERAATEEKRKQTPGVCSCGDAFTGVPGRKRCDDCMQNDESIGSRPHRGSPRKRAEYFGVEYEQVDKRAVFVRDRWRCGICGEKVDKRLKRGHPRAASLDHMVPMSCGGGHTYANTQCAHWDCNVNKSNRGGGEQLALVG
ncbi:MAG: HNH endonuclease [Mycobacterium sp.]|nr:HNH endonuclease [Mycobacterium sp.]